MNWNWIKSLKRPEWTKFEGLNDISRVGGWGVIFIAVVSFVLSYAMLQNLAAANGFWGWQSFLWPLTLDAVVVVSALSVLRKSLHGDKVWILEGDWHEMDVWAWFNWDLLTAWGLVFLFSLASIAFNVIHAYLNLGTALACVMAGLPPFVLLCAVEVQVRDVQGQLRRSKAKGAKSNAKPGETDAKSSPEVESEIEAKLTKEVVSQLIAHEPGITGSEIGRRYGVSARRGQQVLAEVRRNGHA